MEWHLNSSPRVHHFPLEIRVVTAARWAQQNKDKESAHTTLSPRLQNLYGPPSKQTGICLSVSWNELRRTLQASPVKVPSVLPPRVKTTLTLVSIVDQLMPKHSCESQRSRCQRAMFSSSSVYPIRRPLEDTQPDKLNCLVCVSPHCISSGSFFQRTTGESFSPSQVWNRHGACPLTLNRQ